MRCIVLVRSDLRPMFMCITDPQPPNQQWPNTMFYCASHAQYWQYPFAHSLSTPCGVHVLQYFGPLLYFPSLLLASGSFGLSCVSSTDPQPPKPLKVMQALSQKIGRGPANAVRDTFALRYLSSYCEDKRRDMSRDVLLVMVSTGTITYTFRRKEALL